MEAASSILVESLSISVNRLFSQLKVDKALRDMNAILWELDLLRLGADDHMNRNKRSYLEVPDQVTRWLQEVEQIRARVRNLPNNDSGTCFRFFTMPRLVKKVLKIIEVIESLKTQYSLITWTDYPIPLGRVDTMNASMRTTCIPSTHLNDFPSREQIFLEALKELEQNRQSHMVALWGMSGVGKTKMMQNLNKALKEKKMFGFIIEVVVGENTDPIAIQEAVADYLGIDLKESTKLARADKLRRWFEANSNEGKNDILVILDDVWQPIDMNDIGLSPFPDQGIAFKVLLTSRDRDVCARMGVEANSILHVRPLIDVEAQCLFRQFVQVSGNVDPELQKIGEDIVRKCCGLPSAIKSLAGTLKNKGKATWSDALTRLERHNYYNDLPQLFESSYTNLRDEETKSIFLLCGLFPEDFNIPTEDLVRFGWGLKLFKRGSTIREARNRLDTCIEQLMHTNLLIRSDDVGCVKMHGLVLAFVLDMFSKAEHASFVRHDSMPGWPANDTSISTKRISLTCKGMSQFPGDLKFPNLTILKLMYGNESLRFPKGFYGEMKNLHVIAYEKMKCMLLPSSLQCSTNLRVLYLHQCSLMSDCSSIGELSNLEVLSFAHSGIQWLPSTLGNLKKLRLLDLTNCFDLRIDKGVLKKLGKLEELYMRVNDQARVDGRNAISFTDDNCNELAERSKYLSALEFEFFQNNARPENMSFTNIERFKISVGCSLKGTFTKSMHSFENTLKLVTNKGELLESRMNELFQKTKVLCLSVDYMKDLEDVEVNSSLSQQSSSFSNLRVLVFSECPELRYLFTLRIAKALSNLEHLEVYACDNITELINTESGGEETVTFPKLKFLSLILLPNLLGLCRKSNIIELPQLVELRLGAIPNFTSIFPKNNPLASSFLKKEVVSPKLEKLHIRHMENLKEIWPLEVRESDKVNVSLLREIEVTDCDNLVNFFPCNPMPLLHHLKDLEVRNCGSIEVLFNIDLDCFGEIREEVVCSSSLRSIKVYNLGKLRELWSIKSAVNSGLLIRGFQAVEYIEITKCKSFRNVFVPTTINFDLGALMEIWINNKGESGRKNEPAESSQEQQIIVISNEETSEVSDCISNVVFPSYLIHAFRNLKKLKLWNSERPEVVFEIESPQSRELVPSEDNQRLLPYLEELDIRHMDNITQVWKCNWNKLSVFHNHQSESPFHNLTTMHVSECRSMKYLFSPLMAKLLSNLKHVKIAICDDIEEVISNRNDEDEGENEIEQNNATSIHTSTTLFPHLAFLNLYYLRNLKHIGGGNELSFGNTATSTASHQSTFSRVDDVSWSLCQYSKEIRIVECHALLSVIPYHAAGHMHQLQVLRVESCNSMQEVFETHNGPCSNTNIDEGNGDTSAIPRPNNVITLNLANLKILEIKDCGLLEYVFTFSSLQSLWNLEELMIENCKAMKVIVKEEHGEQTSSMVVVFGRLRSISLVNLPNLVDFFSGVNEFRWPLLDKVTVHDCTQMVAFNPVRSVPQIYRSTPGQTSRQPFRRRSS